MSEPDQGQRRPHPGWLLLLATLVVLAVGVQRAPPETSPCPPLTLTVPGAPAGTLAVRRGAEITVTGRGFVADCGGSGEDERLEPMTDVALELVSGRVSRRVTVLDRVDAGSAEQDRLGEVTWSAVVPADAPTGPAALQAEGPRGSVVVLGLELAEAQ